MDKISELKTGKFYKVKNPRKKFLCALCSAPREMKYTKNLKGITYIQILVLATFIAWLLFPFIGEKSLFVILPVWMVIEFVNKSLYRKEISCPYCGFDATWYRRDVNVANQKVKEFWSTNYPDLDKKVPEEVIAGPADLVAESKKFETTSQPNVI
ncbi:MAG: hypothetical protein HON90_11015 [Halobacteriovoraceae bacterium]|jgi:hypothetical protein|nr:hypothetical protein [Halobacteriovoraceae bacterium]